MTRKSCPLCYCINVNKHGRNRGRQRYQRQGCDSTWVGIQRPQRFRNKLWRHYVVECGSITSLARQYHKDKRFTRRELDAYEVYDAIPRAGKVTVIMDVTYFGS